MTSSKKRAVVALAVVTAHWVATFSAPRPLPNAVPVVPKDVAAAVYWRDF